MLHRLLLLLAITAALLAPAAAVAQGKRVALLIGNAAYTVGPLRNPPNDVRVMNESLKALGFQTQVVLDANQNTMRRAVRDFGSRAEGADVALLYYSGHGTQALGENFLIPVQATIEKEADYEIEAISARGVLTQIAGARPKAAVVILDACRDNPLAATTKSTTKGLGRMEAPTGTLIAFATAPGTTASDEGHYARVLAQQLRKPGQEIVSVFRATAAEVLKLSNNKQDPRISEVSINEPLYLAGSQRPPGVQATVVPEPVQPGLDLSDLAGQAAQQAEAQRREQATLARMQGDFDKVAAFSGTPALQAQAWERFLTAWTDAQAATAGAEGTALRQQAQQRRDQAQAQARDAARQPLQAAGGTGSKACPECPETVTLQPGSFQMGSPGSEVGRMSNEGPVRTVRIGYRLAVGKTHVTRGEFAAFVNASGYRTEAEQGDGCFVFSGGKGEKKAGTSWRNPGFEQGGSHPVVCVSWNDAQAYVRWLNDRSPVNGWRLLTEAEYEYAARAGTTTRYWWGDDHGNSQQCQFANGADQSAKRTWNPRWATANCDDGHAYTAPVGSFQANAWGLHDMAGNANSWTQDCFAPSYDGAPTDGSAVNPSSCSQRVLRGGSWVFTPQWSRSAFRFNDSPIFRNSYTGFRLARTVF
ncbi:MAG: SUMF1/EgtB/PvdO family nonheme iron enzyme [Burkholderiales bacterium]|jgi:formylglycine-generating enzyme required for sulfatase activity